MMTVNPFADLGEKISIPLTAREWRALVDRDVSSVPAPQREAAVAAYRAINGELMKRGI